MIRSILRRFAQQRRRNQTIYLLLVAAFFACAYLLRPARAQVPSDTPGAKTEASGIPMAPAGATTHSTFAYFACWSDPEFTTGERAALFASLLVAVSALLYAGMLVGQVTNADQGTKKMQDI